jgi:hypothetical protein
LSSVQLVAVRLSNGPLNVDVEIAFQSTWNFHTLITLR